MLLLLFSCLSVSNGGGESKEGQEKNTRIIEVQELGGCYCKEGFDLSHFNVIPTIDVAFDVALPVLKSANMMDAF